MQAKLVRVWKVSGRTVRQNSSAVLDMICAVINLIGDAVRLTDLHSLLKEFAHSHAWHVCFLHTNRLLAVPRVVLIQENVSGRYNGTQRYHRIKKPQGDHEATCHKLYVQSGPGQAAFHMRLGAGYVEARRGAVSRIVLCIDHALRV